MTENKYVAMMLEEARQSEMLARAGWGQEHAEVAAEWRAAAEAFEAMEDEVIKLRRYGILLESAVIRRGSSRAIDDARSETGVNWVAMHVAATKASTT